MADTRSLLNAWWRHRNDPDRFPEGSIRHRRHGLWRTAAGQCISTNEPIARFERCGGPKQMMEARINALAPAIVFLGACIPEATSAPSVPYCALRYPGLKMESAL